MTTPEVDTRRAQGRRVLHFDTLEDVLADAERLTAGRIESRGNWSAGQAFEHLARWMDFSLDGFPVRVPWLVRVLFGRLILRRALRRGFPAGFRWKGANAAASDPGPTDAAAGLEHLRRSVARLRTETQRSPSPLFGKLSAEEWEQLHLRHAELHLSFLDPVGG
jgi:hypothetical protein